MQHIITSERDEGLKLVYTDLSLQAGKTVEVEYTRTILGVALPDPEREGTRTGYGYACVGGERVFDAKDSTVPSESMYIVLDETDATVAGDLFDSLIAIKDKYLIQAAFCTDKPVNLMESLRNLEGFSKYDKAMVGAERKDKWPSYVSDDCRCAVQYKGVARYEERMLNQWLSQQARDPDTGQPILDGEEDPVHRLVCPLDLPTDKARAGIQREDATVCTAIYLAVSNMETSKKARRTWKPKAIRERNGITGY